MDMVIDIEVEVDMNRRKIAFGLPDGPLVEAPCKLPAVVCPWAYCWNEVRSSHANQPTHTQSESAGSASACCSTCGPSLCGRLPRGGLRAVLTFFNSLTLV